MQLVETHATGPTMSSRSPAIGGVVVAWLLGLSITGAGVLLVVPVCGWSPSLVETISRPANVFSWAVVIVLSVGPPLLLTWGMVALVRGRAPVRLLVYLLSVGCAAASTMVPAVLLGEAVHQNAPSCDIGQAPAWLAVHFIAGAVLCLASVVVVAVSWAHRVRAE